MVNTQGYALATCRLFMRYDRDNVKVLPNPLFVTECKIGGKLGTAQPSLCHRRDEGSGRSANGPWVGRVIIREEFDEPAEYILGSGASATSTPLNLAFELLWLRRANTSASEGADSTASDGTSTAEAAEAEAAAEAEERTMQ